MLSIIKRIFGPLQSRYAGSVSYILCGIGNKGGQYHDTRHNIGFLVIDALLQKCEELDRENACNASIIIEKLPDNGMMVVCAKPTTYVNRSGIAVRQLLQRYNKPLSSCLIIVDDFNLSLGTLRFRRRGSDGGHNGLRSVIDEIGTDFPRLRVGIGPIPKNTGVIDFVLSNFNDRELETRNNMISAAADAVVYFCENGIDAAMNHFNT